MEEIFAEAKTLRLGKIIAELKKENEEMQAREFPSTCPKQIAKCKGNIEDTTDQIE